MSRSGEIRDGLDSVRGRIAAACGDVGRDPAEVTLVVVTKFFPASDVRALVDLGVTHVGENRHQEAVAKAEECADLGLAWHYIGGLQSNKAAAVARMRELGATVITAWIGPHVCGACYEVPEQMRDEVAAVVPEARATTSWGTPALDLGAGVRVQLEAAGVSHVQVVGGCTREDTDFPSYRRDGDASTRFAGVIWMSP